MHRAAISLALVSAIGVSPFVARADGACSWDDKVLGNWRCEDAHVVDVLMDVVPRSVSFQIQPIPSEMCDQNKNAYLTYTPPASVKSPEDRKRNVVVAASALSDALTHGLHVVVIGKVVSSDRPGVCEVHGFHLRQ
jgi:hypothetical protein